MDGLTRTLCDASLWAAAFDSPRQRKLIKEAAKDVLQAKGIAHTDAAQLGDLTVRLLSTRRGRSALFHEMKKADRETTPQAYVASQLKAALDKRGIELPKSVYRWNGEKYFLDAKALDKQPEVFAEWSAEKILLAVAPFAILQRTEAKQIVSLLRRNPAVAELLDAEAPVGVEGPGNDADSNAIATTPPEGDVAEHLKHETSSVMLAVESGQKEPAQRTAESPSLPAEPVGLDVLRSHEQRISELLTAMQARVERAQADLSENLRVQTVRANQELEQTLRAELNAHTLSTRSALDQVVRTQDRTSQELRDKQSEFALGLQSIQSASTAAIATDEITQQLATTSATFAEQIADLKRENEARVSDVGSRIALLHELAEKVERLQEQVAAIAKAPATRGATSSESARAQRRPIPLAWTRSGSTARDVVSLRRSLTSAFKSRGVSPASAIRLHAAVASGLVPIVVGSGAVAAVAAYAHGACGGRLATLHVLPTFMQPSDLIGEADVSGLRIRASGLMPAAEAAKELSSLSLFFCEGINRAPVESYLVPYLQCSAARLPLSVHLDGVESQPTVIPRADGLRLVASSIAGATSVPISRDIWSYAVAVDVEAIPPSGTALEPCDIPLSAELCVPAEVPVGVVEELLTACTLASEVRPALDRYAAMLARFENGDQLRLGIVEAVLLPQLAMLSDEEERVECFDTMQRHLGLGDATKRLSKTLQRIRLRLA